MFNLTHGSTGLSFAYWLVLAFLIAGLRRGRASLMQFVWSPLAAMAAMVLAGVVIALASPLLRLFWISSDSLLQSLFGIAVTASVGYAAGFVIATRTGAPGSQHRRGAVVMNEQSEPQSQAAPRDPSDSNNPVTLAGYPIALQDEPKHFKLIGTTGTGKSTAIRELLGGALARGDRAIIADPDGGYLDTFYDAGRGDVILNPFTPAGEKWSLFSEVTNDYDVEQLAHALISDSHDPDTTWIEYGRTFFIALVQQCRDAGISDDRELWRFVVSAAPHELKMLLGNTAAAPFLATVNEKMLSAVRSITGSALRALKYTTQQQGTAFSVRQWVSQGRPRLTGGQGGVLFLPCMAGEIAALRSTISAWMRIAIFEAMSRPEGDQRLWFVIDELDALGEIDGLKDALARVRKFGGRCILGLQSISQVSGTYKAAAHAIVENCGTTVIFRCSASEHGGTSEFASKLIGQREVLHTTRSKTRRPGSWRSSTTTSESIRIEPAIMPSEIERLPDLHGFLKIASLPDWQRVTLTPPNNSAQTRGKRPTTQPTTTAPTQTPTSSSANMPPATPTPPSAAPSPPTPSEPGKTPSAAPRRTKSTKSARPTKAAPKRPRKPRTRVQVPTVPPPITNPVDTQQPSA